MKVTILQIVIGAFSTVTKGLLKRLEDMEIGGRVETTQKHFLERPEYWEESWRPEKICCHSNSSERPTANAVVKNSLGVNNNNNNNNINCNCKTEINFPMDDLCNLKNVVYQAIIFAK